eukprot:4681282-Amphidinium_carterae.1
MTLKFKVPTPQQGIHKTFPANDHRVYLHVQHTEEDVVVGAETNKNHCKTTPVRLSGRKHSALLPEDHRT